MKKSGIFPTKKNLFQKLFTKETSSSSKKEEQSIDGTNNSIPKLNLTEESLKEATDREAQQNRQRMIDNYISFSNTAMRHLLDLTKLLDDELAPIIRQTLAHKTYYIRDKYSPEQANSDDDKTERAQKLSEILKGTKLIHLVSPNDFSQSAYENFLASTIKPVKNPSTQYANEEEVMTVKDFIESSDLTIILRLNSFYLPEANSSFRDKYEDFTKAFINLCKIEDQEYNQIEILAETEIFFVKEMIRIIITTFNFLFSYTIKAASFNKKETYFSGSIIGGALKSTKTIKLIQKWIADEYYKDIRENIQAEPNSDKTTAISSKDIYIALIANQETLRTIWQEGLTEIKKNTEFKEHSEIATQFLSAIDKSRELLKNLSESLGEEFITASINLEKEISRINKPQTDRSGQQLSRRRRYASSSNIELKFSPRKSDTESSSSDSQKDEAEEAKKAPFNTLPSQQLQRKDIEAILQNLPESPSINRHKSSMLKRKTRSVEERSIHNQIRNLNLNHRNK